MNLTVKQIVKICKATLYCGDEDVVCSTFNIDTRNIKSGETYFGIKGNNFDGNELYKEAFLKGANCCIIEKKSFKIDDDYIYDKPIILVTKTKSALRQLAKYVRGKSDALFIGITGSVGKTSTKDMIYSVVSQKYKALKTEANYNNDIGLPLTIMRLQDEKCAIIEMGMNNFKEIDYLTNITLPHIAVITNIGTAHIGNLGSRENILRAKLEIKNGLVDGGLLVINNDNDLLHDYYLHNKNNIFTIGINNKSDVMATDIVINNDNAIFNVLYNEHKYEVKCPIPNTAFIYNSLVAFMVGILSNVPIDKIIKGINSFHLTKNRIEIIKKKDNITIINDSYNASVDSMKSGLQLLNSYKNTRKIAVLGSMFELGKYSKILHEEVGKYVIDNEVDLLITIGEDAKYIANIAKKELKDRVFSFDNNKEAIDEIKKMIKPNDTILIKASNGMKFIEIVNELKK